MNNQSLLFSSASTRTNPQILLLLFVSIVDKKLDYARD